MVREPRQVRKEAAVSDRLRVPWGDLAGAGRSTRARKPSFDSLRRLATALDVTTDWLLGQVDNPDQSAASDPLYRHIQNLSAADRDNARKIIEALSDKPKPPDKE